MDQSIYLVVYVDDIVIIQIGDLDKLKYFTRIKVVQSNAVVVISQRKYMIDILKEISMFECKLVDTPMNLMLNFYQVRRRLWPNLEDTRDL